MINFSAYQTSGFYDELFASDGVAHSFALPLIQHITSLSPTDLKRRQKAAELALFNQGITFSVYGSKHGAEKIFPFDVLPRVIPHKEWQLMEQGIKQRVQALNLFINDIYNDKKILKDNIIPRELVLSSPCYLKQCEGLKPPKSIWIHISGTDFVRDERGELYILEDNLRCPSGVAYVLENRAVQKHTFPNAFQSMNVQPISNYCDHLYETLRYASHHDDEQCVVVLTPGPYNSAYFEHSYLARQMGIILAEGSDLVVIDDHVMLRTTQGFKKVDVIYRRIDDAFLDPQTFRKDSLLGIPGLMDCYRKGHVSLVNAPGTGIADDKAIYAYVPKIIKYYLGEEPIIANVPTYICSDKKHLEYVNSHLEQMVVKEVNLSGGYGMLIGHTSSKEQRKQFSDKINKNPRNFIAQPTLALSQSPTIIGDKIVGRHVDFRPYTLYGKDQFVLPGGLTRVALTKDSLVVNSSQGGGSKDTWVLGEDTSQSQEG